MKLTVIILLSFFVTKFHAQNVYGLRNVTIDYSDNCKEDITNPNDLHYCKETVREIDWKICWLTSVQTNGYYTKGVAIYSGEGGHHVWVKEVTDYDPDNNIISTFYDSLTHVNLIQPKHFKTLKEYLIKNERFILRDRNNVTTPIPEYRFYQYPYEK